MAQEEHQVISYEVDEQIFKITDANDLKVYIKYIEDTNSKLKYIHIDGKYFIENSRFKTDRSVELAVQFVEGTIKPTKKFDQSKVDKLRYLVKDGIELYRFIKDHKKHITAFEQGRSFISFSYTASGKDLKRIFEWGDEDIASINLMQNKIYSFKSSSEIMVASVHQKKDELFDKLLTSNLKEISVYNTGKVAIRNTAGELLEETEVFRFSLCTNQMFRHAADGKDAIVISRLTSNKDIILIEIKYDDSLFSASSYFTALNTM